MQALCPEGGGGTPYNGLYGEAPPERGTFSAKMVYERVRGWTSGSPRGGVSVSTEIF